MTVDAYLPDFRSDAESLMVDECVITRVDPDGEPGEMDPVTMQYPEAERVTVYEGRCRLQVRSAIAGGRDSDAGDRRGTTQEVELQLPVDDSAGVAIRDVALMTKTRDPAALDREFTIDALHHKTDATARRLRVVEGTA